jgi:hypothetical protein
MLALTLLLGVLAHGAPIDTLASAGADSAATPATPVASVAAVATGALLAPAMDTVPRRRPRAVEVSDGYATRLRVHRLASYTLIPLFAAQSIAGNQMYQSGGPTPGWAKSMHSVGAGGLGALFTINTVTGVWNLWETRSQSEGRTRRLLHGGLLLASDAGFAYAGIKLGPDATRSGERRREHRRVAYISMSGALLGYATMLIGNR